MSDVKCAKVLYRAAERDVLTWGVAAIAKVCESVEQRDPRQNPAGEFHYVDEVSSG